MREDIEDISPKRLLILDIDGCCQDHFHTALAGMPNLSGILGGPQAAFGIHLDPVTTAPSITFCAQTTIFTGQPPNRHGIAGNQFLDRLTRGAPLYALDVGDFLAYDDAAAVFLGEGLINTLLDPSLPTLYEIAAPYGFQATVAHHMLSRGAAAWLPPNLMEIARFTKGGSRFGMLPDAYDERMIQRIFHHLDEGNRPHILTAYFMGLDHHTHQHGRGVQVDYLTQIIDPQIGRLVHGLEQRGFFLPAQTLVVVVSDHGQTDGVADERHSLRMGFPFEHELSRVFDALGLDVSDLPGEGSNTDAVLASNGGLAHLYLRRRPGGWQDPPYFQSDVLPVAQAFWEANHTGRYLEDLHGALDMVLVHNTEQEGWGAPYQVYTPQGLQPVQAYLETQPQIQALEAVSRLQDLAGPRSGDLLLAANSAAGVYFGGPTAGTHGGLVPAESLAVLSLAWPGASPRQVEHLQEIAFGISHLDEKCSLVRLTSLVPILSELFRWRTSVG